MIRLRGYPNVVLK